MTVTAAILCGGQGTRLKPVIGDLPKCLAPVYDRDRGNREPFLHFIMRHLYSEGIREFVLCTGHGTELVEKAMMTNRYVGVIFSREDEPLGTAGAIRLAYERSLLPSDPILVVNGDTWCPFKLDPLLKWHKAKGCKETILKGNPQWTDLDEGEKRSTGVSLMSRDIIERLNGPWDWDTLSCYVDVPFLDIGTPERYAVAEDVLNG